jgi:hypothetical protein
MRPQVHQHFTDVQKPSLHIGRNGLSFMRRQWMQGHPFDGAFF